MVFEQILQEIDRRKQKNRVFVIGITGIDASGKTKFTESLAGFLLSLERNVQVIHLDHFHNPQKVRYSGENHAENYFYRSFDVETIVNKLLVPLGMYSSYSVKLTLLDVLTDRYEIEKQFSFSGDTIVLFEGVFLFRNELSQYIDYKIFLEISFDESKKRAASRDSMANLQKYDEKYLPAQRRYLAEHPPSETADMIIDNSNWISPKVKFFRGVG
jgi:uridine kinase